MANLNKSARLKSCILPLNMKTAPYIRAQLDKQEQKHGINHNNNKGACTKMI